MRTIKDFFHGVGLLFNGFRLFVTMPRTMLLGVIPAVIVGTVYLAAIIALVLSLDPLVSWSTRWAQGWQFEPLIRIGFGVAMVFFAAVIIVYSFVAVTLTVGDYFYEKIWRSVEQSLGAPPASRDEPAVRAALRGIATGLRLFFATVLAALAVALIGFIPVAGQLIAPVLGACLAGWFLSLETSGFAFDARGVTLRERRQLLGERRARSIGFGLACYLLFLIPFAAIIVMPAAVAGATMLAREALDHRATKSAS